MEQDVHISRSLYINVLKYVDEHPGGVTKKDIHEGFNLSGEEMGIIWKELTGNRQGRASLLMHSGNSVLNRDGGGELGKFILSFEGASFLQEHDELEQARNYAKQSSITACIAIGISFFGFIASVGFSSYQIYSPSDVRVIENDSCDL